MSAPARTLSTDAGKRLSSATRLNVAGLVLTSAAMLVQVAAGSSLYPSVTGPIVLAVTALAVMFVQRRWSAYLGLAVPLALGVGAIVAAVMTGGFVGQLTNPANPGIFVGSAVHVLGLTAAVVGGIRMVSDPRETATRER